MILSRVAAGVLLASAANAAERETQIAGLFTQACVFHAGDPAGLRGWVRDAGLPALPQAGQAAFLRGASGVAYDATNRDGGKMALLMTDDGACAVAAPGADRPALVAAVEADLAATGIAASASETRTDAVVTRTYAAHRAARGWLLVIATGIDPRAPVQLTAQTAPAR